MTRDLILNVDTTPIETSIRDAKHAASCFGDAGSSVLLEVLAQLISQPGGIELTATSKLAAEVALVEVRVSFGSTPRDFFHALAAAAMLRSFSLQTERPT